MNLSTISHRLLRSTALTALLLAGFATPAVASGPDRADLRAAVERIAGLGFTGVQLRVHDEHGDWAGSAGVSRLDRPGKPPVNGRFRVGSVTKTFTATVLLQLVGEGRIRLDDTVAPHLPGLGLDPRITVRMLLQHTSGVFNYTGQYYPDGTLVPGITWSGKEWVESRFRTYRPSELARYALSKPAPYEPGTKWTYSNTNYTLALLLIEKITGKGYAEVIDRRIVRPLGLSGTVAPGTSPEVPGPHAHTYYRYDDGGREKIVDITRQNPSWAPGAGDLISTTRDLGVFFSALNSGKLLPPALLAEMRTPESEYGYGLGMFVLDVGPECGDVILNHDGNVQGYAALMYSSPDGRTTLTGSITYVDESSQSLAAAYQEARKILLDEVFCGE